MADSSLRPFLQAAKAGLIERLPRNLFQRRNLGVFAHDIVMAYAAFLAAFYLRLGPHVFVAQPDIFLSAGAFALVAALVYLFTGIYRHVWEYVSARDAFNLVRTATLVVLLFLPAWFFATRLQMLPRSMPILSGVLLAAFLGGPRLLVRVARDHQLQGRARGAPGASTVLLVGDGSEAEQFVRAIARDVTSPYTVVGMTTVDRARVGQVIHGVEVLGHDDDLPAIIARLDANELKPDRLVIVRRNVSGAQVQALLAVAQATGCQLARIPPTTLHPYGSDDATLRPRPIALEDLLGRSQLQLDRAAMTAMIAGRRILVTGAGGSIGAELAQQISDAGPAALTLLDHSEFALYSIDLEIRRLHPALNFTAVLADVRDPMRLTEIFAKARPEIVFHAAALKQVPMVELNPLEGVLTNAIGTRHVADACVAAGAAAMVLISTDKAVNPANVMGASKRAAEIYCQALDLRRTGTRFITVRFGNVLGSAGSVVPLFQKQLEMGGPLTVTHPDIERFFMTVREAVELVLQAAALGQARADQGAIYVLDMGQPVKIMDLARQMIRLAGKLPDVDVAIVISGLRPGEKMSEELFHGEEPPAPTGMAGVLLAHPRTLDHAVVAAKLTSLAEACRRRDEAAAFALVHDLVPELMRPTPVLRLVK